MGTVAPPGELRPRYRAASLTADDGYAEGVKSNAGNLLLKLARGETNVEGARQGAELLHLLKAKGDSSPVGAMQGAALLHLLKADVSEEAGVIEAQRHADGQWYVHISGAWMQVAGKYYCQHCMVSGSTLRDHIESDFHRKNVRQACPARSNGVASWEGGFGVKA